MFNLSQLEELIVSNTLYAVLGFLKVVTIIWFIDHWIACIFYLIGAQEATTDPMSWIIVADIID